jgi:hypothetical protein
MYRKDEDKVIPLRPEGSSGWKLPDFKIIGT